MLLRLTALMILSSGISNASVVDDAVSTTFVMVALVLMLELLLPPLLLLLLLLFAVRAVRSVDRSSASMSSKSPSVSALATSTPWCLPILFFFGILSEVSINTSNVDLCYYDVKDKGSETGVINALGRGSSGGCSKRPRAQEAGQELENWKRQTMKEQKKIGDRGRGNRNRT
jgi:hypothetical protein